MTKTYTCHCCGKTYTKNLDPDVYRKGNCFDCSFWLLKTEYHEDLAERRVVVDGNHYMISAVTDTYPQGFGGRQFIIQFFDGRIIKTNNLWSQGTIPERFRKMLPDNAIFLPITEVPMFDDIFPDWDDIAFAGAMGEEMAEEELERRREAEREADQEER